MGYFGFLKQEQKQKLKNNLKIYLVFIAVMISDIRLFASFDSVTFP